VGRRNRRVIRLGDKVEVQVSKVDSFKKQVDFRLAKVSGGSAKTGTIKSGLRPKGGANVPASRGAQSGPPWRRESRPKQKFGDRKFGGGRRRPKK